MAITAKQYLRDQLSNSTTDLVDKILNHFEKQGQENWTFNHDKQRREDTCVSSNSDKQQSNMQEHNVNQIPTNSEKRKNHNTYQSTGTETSQMKTLTATHDMED